MKQVPRCEEVPEFNQCMCMARYLRRYWPRRGANGCALSYDVQDSKHEPYFFKSPAGRQGSIRYKGTVATAMVAQGTVAVSSNLQLQEKIHLVQWIGIGV